MKNVNRGEEEDKNSGRFIHGGDQSLFGIGKLKSGVEGGSSESIGVECRLELPRGLKWWRSCPVLVCGLQHQATASLRFMYRGPITIFLHGNTDD